MPVLFLSTDIVMLRLYFMGPSHTLRDDGIQNAADYEWIGSR